MRISSLPIWTSFILLAGCGGCNRDKDGVEESLPPEITDDDGDGYDSDVDCDDDDSDVHPDALEVCDGVDNDCDDAIDDADPSVDDSTKDTWYTDQDGDYYGTDDSAMLACSQPYGNSVIDGGDCDDDDEDINPGELEICDGIDNDCDGDTDINAVDGDLVYEDLDGDHYGSDEVSITVCQETEGYSATPGDCDDGAVNVNPGEVEACFNDIDDNCDGATDDACPEEKCGDIEEDTTWEYSEFGYFVSCDIAVLAELHIEPNTTIYFAPDVGMTVGVEGSGALIVEAEDNGVAFTSGVSILYPDVASAPGDWTGLVIGDEADEYSMRLEGLSLWYAGGDDSDGALVMDGASLTFNAGEVCGSGGDGFVAANGAMPEITNSLLCDNLGHGFYADDESGLAAFEDNTLSGNGAYPISVLASYGDVIEGTNTIDPHDEDVYYIELRGDTIVSDITLAAQDCPYTITSDVSIASDGGPLMTLEDGVIIAFAYDAGLTIGSTAASGDLTVQGTDEGVMLTALDDARGWDGVTVQQGSDALDVEGLTIEYGGNNGKGNLYLVNGSAGISVSIDGSTFTHSSSNGIYVGPKVTPLIVGSTISNNDEYGVYVSDSGDSEGGLYVEEGGASFVGNVITGNGAPITLPASYLDQLDDSSSFTGNDSEYIEVTASTVTRTGTWQQLDQDYWVLGDIKIENSSSPIVTVAEGATLYMDPDVSLSVGSSSAGGLLTEGSSSSPVTFTSAAASPAPEDWDGIEFGSKAVSSSELAYAVVSYAGGNGYGGVYISSSSPTLSDSEISYNGANGVYITGSAAEPDITGCDISNNEESGVYLFTSAGLGDFSENTMTGNGEFPVSLSVEYAGALDADSSYTGNGDDRVELRGDGISDDASWVGLEVPYLSEEAIVVSADLILGAGLSMEFSGASSGLTIGSLTSGSLTVNGTSSSHVTLTSAEASPSSGDWGGVTLSSYCTASTIKYLDVTFADVGLYVNCNKSITVNNSSFTESDSYDIKCSSRATSVTWTSVTYDTNSGC